MWIKRDDLFADPLGGNKARALEFLLGGVRSGDSVVTVGSVGSTHALAVATYARRLGASVFVGRWRQEMNDAARRVARGIEAATNDAPVFRTPIGAYAWAFRRRFRGARWIPAGGSSALGVLGHLNAGLELVAQIEAGAVPEPRYVVVPLGTGGTAAGIALAFAIARRPTVVIGARVVPWIVARAARVHALAARTGMLIERANGTAVPRLGVKAFEVAHEAYGGAYGRETEKGRAAATRMREGTGLALDSTYSAKAFGHALELAAHGETLFWLTFDPRSLGSL